MIARHSRAAHYNVLNIRERPEAEDLEKGTCGNHLTIRREEVEGRVLKALKERLLRQDLFEEFCEEFTREMNRLRVEHRANLVTCQRELAGLEPGARGWCIRSWTACRRPRSAMS